MKKFLLVIVAVLMLVGCNTKPNQTDGDILVLRVSGKETIDFETLNELLESSSDYLLYIGRKSCGTCVNFESFLEEYFLENPTHGFYYFDTDTIKDIALGENPDPVIAEFYEKRTEKLNYKWTPTIHHYVNKEIVDTFEYLSMEYYEASEETQKNELQNKANQSFIDWMASNY